MSQDEVYTWLKEKGDGKFYTVSELHKHLNIVRSEIDKITRSAIDKNVSKLIYHGFLEVEHDGLTNTRYVRLRMKHKATVST